MFLEKERSWNIDCCNVVWMFVFLCNQKNQTEEEILEKKEVEPPLLDGPSTESPADSGIEAAPLEAADEAPATFVDGV